MLYTIDVITDIPSCSHAPILVIWYLSNMVVYILIYLLSLISWIPNPDLRAK